MVEKEEDNMVNNAQRTIKISAEAYQTLSHLSKEDGEPMGEIASAIILAALIDHPQGEQYNPKTGKRLFF